jgi:transposase-like protein
MSRAAGLRRAVRRVGPRGRGRRLPEDLRDELRAEAVALAGRGEPIVRIARALGISASSVRRWCTATSPRSPSLVPVVVREEPRLDAVVHVVSPSGWRIEGVELDTAVRLLRGLS